MVISYAIIDEQRDEEKPFRNQKDPRHRGLQLQAPTSRSLLKNQGLLIGEEVTPPTFEISPPPLFHEIMMLRNRKGEIQKSFG